MMTPEILLLCATAAAIAFVHTLAGPDHYLPFVALARSRQWPLRKAVSTTLWCGAGHILGSVILGLVGLYASVQLGALEWIESTRGDIAAWALVSFGLVYTAWGLRRAWRNRTHTHDHSHGGLRHSHRHDHRDGHAHTHTPEELRHQRRSLVGWAIFIVFVLGPCEPLIPVLMFPAAQQSLVGLFAVTAVFAAVTLVTMLAVVVLSLWGLRSVRMPRIGRFSEAIAGCTITCCGLSLALLGL
jgi:ABC-type nickel/cobalt efflux system permease component RcnA